MTNVAHRLVCLDCGEPIRPGAPYLQRAHGWVQPRRDGGVHHLVGGAELEPGAFICKTCFTVRRYGGQPLTLDLP